MDDELEVEGIDIDEEINEVEWSDKDSKKRTEYIDKYTKLKTKAVMKAEKRRFQREIDDINKSYRPFDEERKKKRTTSKFIMYVLLINCAIVEMYSMWVMVELSDLSALYSLIGAIVTQAISYAIYCAKAFNESKEEARVALDRDVFESELDANSFDDLMDNDENCTNGISDE